MRYPAGPTTSTFRLKALLLHLRDREGRTKARQFAELIGGGAIVDDETRPIARTLWYRALEEFSRIAGEARLREVGSFLVHAETLGAWSRVLRGAASPDDVFRQLGDATEGIPGDTMWSTEEAGPRTWTARADLSGAETARERQLLRTILTSELEAIPTLFGYRPGRVTVLDDSAHAFVFRVVWAKPGWTPLWIALVFGVLWFVLVSVSERTGGFGSHGLGPGGLELLRWLPPLVFLGVGWVTHRDSLRQADTDLQRVRILALEREAALRQTRSKEISRPHEEPVIAGQYRVGGQLGVGATGAVWAATRLTDRAEVAIKLLRTAVVHDVRATDRLRREAEALGLSWHPHVVEVYDSGILPSGVGFLVMECLHGETLAERLHRVKRLGLAETKMLGIQAADALLAVHSAGVVHRDIKPGNLFLHRTEDGPEILKLIDFGVARVSWAETRLTRSGVRIGTLGYASPEQEEGGDVDGRSDLYGLGVSLRECLTGRMPAGRHQSEPPASTNPLPPAWVAVLDRMTAALPENRFPSARELREALEGLPVEPGRDSSGPPIVPNEGAA